jgi:putative GTP pyrophosphokinase
MDDASALLTAYEARLSLASELCQTLTDRVREALDGVPHIDRITFRTKSAGSFLAKAQSVDEDRQLKYADPLREIEDQVAGRVIVFFRGDLEPVTARLGQQLGPIEAVRKEPVGDAEFGYESEHFIFVIPNHLKPPRWLDDDATPTTFEMQVRTLFMHAWAEPQHDLGYKPGGKISVTREQRRSLAWVAASSWGADRILNDVASELGALAGGGPGTPTS